MTNESCNFISGFFERFIPVISCNSWAKLRVAEESFFFKLLRKYITTGSSQLLWKQDWFTTDANEARSSKLEARRRASSCGAVSYFKSGRTILKVRQLRCWRGGRDRIGVISHSPPLGQLHPRSLQSCPCSFLFLLFSSH